jgi:hypothetical protein
VEPGLSSTPIQDRDSDCLADSDTQSMGVGRAWLPGIICLTGGCWLVPPLSPGSLELDDQG